MMSAAEFDRWYADRVESPVADALVQRALGLPPELRSTSLLGGAGLDEVVAALDLRHDQVLPAFDAVRRVLAVASVSG